MFKDSVLATKVQKSSGKFRTNINFPPRKKGQIRIINQTQVNNIELEKKCG